MTAAEMLARVADGDFSDEVKDWMSSVVQISIRKGITLEAAAGIGDVRKGVTRFVRNELIKEALPHMDGKSINAKTSRLILAIHSDKPAPEPVEKLRLLKAAGVNTLDQRQLIRICQEEPHCQ